MYVVDTGFVPCSSFEKWSGYVDKGTDISRLIATVAGPNLEPQEISDGMISAK
jgi:hypothetical protein